MARVYYERLSDESAEYLENERSRRRAHTAMILVFEGGDLASAEGGVDFDRIRKIVMSRLPELPRLRTKLRRVPVDGHPVWVDDQEFNLDYHLRQSSLPRPGNYDQLCRTAARIAATRLDRSRPLWDCWVIEGLEGGRFAIVLKMHKCLAGLEGADLLHSLLAAAPDSEPVSTGRFSPRPAPSPAELFRQEVLGRWSPSRRAVRRLMRLAESPAEVGRQLQDQATGVLNALGYKLRSTSESPFEGELGPHRSFSVVPVALSDVQAIRQSLGGSVHDVVLGIFCGALRRFIEELHVSPAMVDLRAVTPILDAQGERADPFVVELPVWEEDAARRLEILCEQTRRIRAENDVASAESLSGSGEWNAGRLFAIGARALKELRMGQIAILQSPGSRESLYLAGARLEACFGILPLQDSSGLGLTVINYADSLFIAINADPDVVPEVARLRQAIEAEMSDLVAAAEVRGPSLRSVG